MSVQLSRNIKIFVTTNLSASGVVLGSGFTADNTSELIIIDGSFSFSQQKSFSYVSNHDAIDPVSQLEFRSDANKDIGRLSMGTALNSSATGPFDARLWNATVSNTRYPTSMWTLNSGDHTLEILRQTQKTVTVGLIVVVDSVTYLFDAVRVENANISFDIQSVASTSWECVFEAYRIVEASSTTSGSTVTFSGALTGTAKSTDASTYAWAGGKLTRVTLARTGNLNPVTLAATALEVRLQNNQVYITDIGIDRTDLGNLYTDAGAFKLEGALSVYSRSPGSTAYTLAQEVLAQINDPYSTTLYEVLVEVFSSAQVKLLDLQLYNCSLESLTQVDGTFTDNYTFKVIDGVAAQNCFVKFYT